MVSSGAGSAGLASAFGAAFAFGLGGAFFSATFAFGGFFSSSQEQTSTAAARTYTPSLMDWRTDIPLLHGIRFPEWTDFIAEPVP